jgi:hypothetical protein
VQFAVATSSGDRTFESSCHCAADCFIEIGNRIFGRGTDTRQSSQEKRLGEIGFAIEDILHIRFRLFMLANCGKRIASQPKRINVMTVDSQHLRKVFDRSEMSLPGEMRSAAMKQRRRSSSGRAVVETTRALAPAPS